jgi:hypothetical protein
MFTGLYMNDMDRRDDTPSDVPLGTFGAYDIAVGVAYGRYIVPNVAIGVSVKPVYERIDELSVSALAFDAGIYHVSRIKGVKLAATVANLGAPVKYQEQEFALPRYAKIGASYEREVPAIDGRVLLTFDAMFPNDDGVREHIGGEYSYKRMLSLRAGYKAGYDSQGATFGFGVVYHDIGLDYAFLPVSNDLGDSHRFAVNFSF